jgi:serine/threonine protein kinase
MVMERCSFSLLHHLDHVAELTECTLGQVFAQLLRGLAHMHASHVVHRDLKPDNFLIGDDGQTVKIADFGFSIRLQKGGKLRGMCGTAPFMSPEMLADGGYDSKVDLWSIGVSVYVLLFGVFPYMPKEPGCKLMKMAIAGGVRPNFKPVGNSTKETSFRTEPAVTFVKNLLCRRPEGRPSATEALNMEFMVASAAGRHADGIELPSLRTMLRSAKKVGAFDMREVRTDEDVDGLLNTLQEEKHGVPLIGLQATTSAEFQETKSGSSCSTKCPSIDLESSCESFHKIS